MRIPVNPISGVGGLLVAGATQVAANTGGLNAAIVTGVCGVLAVVLGQLIPAWFRRRSDRSEAKVLAMYQAEIERQAKRIGELEELADRRRRPRG